MICHDTRVVICNILVGFKELSPQNVLRCALENTSQDSKFYHMQLNKKICMQCNISIRKLHTRLTTWKKYANIKKIPHPSLHFSNGPSLKVNNLPTFIEPPNLFIFEQLCWSYYSTKLPNSRFKTAIYFICVRTCLYLHVNKNITFVNIFLFIAIINHRYDHPIEQTESSPIWVQEDFYMITRGFIFCRDFTNCKHNFQTKRERSVWKVEKRTEKLL